jgi:GAF domain-containing protein
VSRKNAPVKLSAILDGLDPISEEYHAYLDTKKGEVVFVGEDESYFDEDSDEDEGGADWEKDERQIALAVAEDAEGRFLPLPTKYEIHEYGIMEEFSRSLENEEASDELCDAIRGEGAFRRFKDTIHRLGIADRWYKYRDAALKQIAIDWCKESGVRYDDDIVQRPEPKSRETKHFKALQADDAAILESERDPIANAANIAAIVYHGLPNLNWAGFYFLKGDELVLGPFQGKPACTRIALGKGVCGTAARKRKTLVVGNVHEFPGHIACDEASKSEIVVPLVKDGRLIGVLDVDSPWFDRFGKEEQDLLEEVAKRFLSSSDIPLE